MHIPKDLPQFETLPALFITSGEYEACFYVAQKGTLTLTEEVSLPPRKNANEKQAFVGTKNGRWGLGAVSHHGAYIEDLKRKFTKRFHEILTDLIRQYGSKEIYLFAPRHVANRVTKKFLKPEQDEVRMRFYQEETKVNPLIMVKKAWETEQRALHEKKSPSKEAANILRKTIV